MRKSSLRVLTSFILISFFLGFTYNTFSQEISLRNEFRYKILVRMVGEKIKLSCTEGCNWKDLSFTLNENMLQFVDNNGLVADAEPEDRRNSSFIFSLRKAEDILYFESLKGSKWEKLNFSCTQINCMNEIDQDGMVAPQLEQ